MNQKTTNGEELAEFKAGLEAATPEVMAGQEVDPDIPEELFQPVATPYARSNLTVALQFLPEDGNPKGRRVLLIVKNDSLARPIRLLREAELGPLPNLIQRLLQELQLEITSQPKTATTAPTAKTNKPVVQSTSSVKDSKPAGSEVKPATSAPTSSSWAVPAKPPTPKSQATPSAGETKTEITRSVPAKVNEKAGLKQASMFELL